MSSASYTSNAFADGLSPTGSRNSDGRPLLISSQASDADLEPTMASPTHSPKSPGFDNGSSVENSADAEHASPFATLMNLVKPFIGAGILALPAAFKSGGIIASSIVMLVLAIVVNYCIRQLLACAQLIQRRKALDAHVAATRDSTADESSDLLSVAAATVVKDETKNSVSIAENGRASSSSSLTPAKGISSYGTVNGGNSNEFVSNIPIPTYREIGWQAYGKWGLALVDFNLVASQIGFCIAYVSFISTNMSDISDAVSRVQWLFILFGALSLLIQVRQISKLAPASLAGNVIYAVCIFLIFLDGFQNHCCSTWDDLKAVDFGGLPFLFGTACFALEGAGLVLPVKSSMERKELFSPLLNTAISIVTSLYISFAVLCYLFFGSHTNSTITKNLTSGWQADTVRISLCVSLYFSYAIQMFPVLQMADEMVDRRYFVPKSKALMTSATQGSDPSLSYRNGGVALTETPSSSALAAGAEPTFSDPHASGHSMESQIAPQLRRWRIVTHSSIRVLLVALTVVVALVFENFGIVVSLVGSLSNSAIAFILPQVFYLKIVRPHERQSRQEAEAEAQQHEHPRFVSNHFRKELVQLYLPWLIIVVGVAASILGLYFTIHDIVIPPDDDDSS